MTSQPKRAEDVNALAIAYHRHGETRADEDFWAWERVSGIVNGADPEQAWELVVSLVRTSSDERLEYVGAGPVEDLVYRHGQTLIDWIEGEANRDPRFREALSSIWLVAEDVPEAALSRLQAATNQRILVHTQAEIDAANPDPA